MSLVALLLAAAQHHDHAVPAATCLPEHAAMGHCAMAEPPPPSTGGTDLPAGDAPPPPAPRVGAAEAIFGAEAMTAARTRLYADHGGMTVSRIMIDRAEVRVGRGADGYAWDGEAWIGGDIDRLVLKAKGEGAWNHGLEAGEARALWSHAIGPYFDAQLGVRQDFGPGPSPTYAALGIEGLAPYWFDVEGTIFLSDKGDVTARLEAGHDLRITQRLILQPAAEADLAFQDVAGRGIGRGLSGVELGLRLRYEIAREFAPYVGVGWERRLGRTARMARAVGASPSRPAFVAGIRFWF